MTRKVKTSDELNRIIAKHLDVLDGSDVSADDVKKALLAVSSLIGTQIKNDNKLINYEYLRLRGGRRIRHLETRKQTGSNQ